MSANAQAALRDLIEKSTYVRFIMTANEIGKLQRALKSRCKPIRFDVVPLDAEAAIKRLLPRYTDKLVQLGYDIDGSWLEKEIRLAFPDLRKVANSIEFAHGVPDQQRAKLFQMERDRKPGSSEAGGEAA